MTGCTQHIATLPFVTTKEINLNNGHFLIGERVAAADARFMFIFPFGVPSVEAATNKAIDSEKCAVALANYVIKNERFDVFGVGYVKYKVEGDLVIDKNKVGCDYYQVKRSSVIKEIL